MTRGETRKTVIHLKEKVGSERKEQTAIEKEGSALGIGISEF